MEFTRLWNEAGALGAEGHLPFVAFSNADLVIGIVKVYLGEVPGHTQTVQ
jgi:hypothetical protein